MQKFDISFMSGVSDRLELEHIREQDPDLFSLQQRFYDLHAKEYQNLDPRFYQHDPEGAFSKDEFQQLLGPDTVPGFHPVVQLGAIRDFKLPHELGVVAITHDWGELIVGDDIYCETPDDSKKQLETDKRHEFVEDEFPSNYDTLNILIDNALDPNTETGYQFKLSERLGYMKTILRAFSLSIEFERLQRFDRKIQVLHSISSHALLHIKHLDTASMSNRNIFEFLERNAKAIEIIQSKFYEPNIPEPKVA